MDKDFKKLLVNTVTRAPYVSENGAGDITYGSPTTVKCFISCYLVRSIVDGSVIITSSGVFYVDEIEGAKLKVKDMITFPDGNKATIAKMLPINDDKGILQAVEVTV